MSFSEGIPKALTMTVITFFSPRNIGPRVLMYCTSLPNADTKDNAYLKSNSTPKIIRDTGETVPTEPTESIQRGPGSGTSEAPLTYTNDMGGVHWQIANISINLI